MQPGKLFNGLLTCLFLLVSTFLSAQQIGFGLYSSQGLTLTPLVPDELDFGDRMRDEGAVSILLTNEEAVVLEIEGVAYLDVTVTITPPGGDVLTLEGDPAFLGDPQRSMPVTIKAAFYNKGQEGIPLETAKLEATEVTGHSATFQIRRRPGGPPGPPPVPPHAGYTPPTASAYLFIYGDLTVGNVHAGPYSAIIDIHVEYANYE